MKNLVRSLSVAAAFLALASIVHASKRSRGNANAAAPAFAISGSLRGSLRPGRSQWVDLALDNRTRAALWITDLRVGLDVDPDHRAAGCSPERDFSIEQLPANAFPIVLPARRPFRQGWPAPLLWTATQRWSLGALGVTGLPAIAMQDLPQTNQDACKGAALRLSFTGTARKAQARRVRRP
jgi:hypothetical protein